MNKEQLKWNDWGDQEKVPKGIKTNELFLVEIEAKGCYKYRSGMVRPISGDDTLCIIGDHFLSDRPPIRWASIQHLIEETTNE